VAGVGDERPLVGQRLPQALEHLVQGGAEAGDLVASRRHRQALVGLGGRDLRRPRAHRLDRPQRRRRHPVGRQRRQQQGDRAADQEQLREVGQRLTARFGRGADDDDPLLPPRLDRDREQARLLLQARQRAAIEEDRLAQRPLQLGPRQQHVLADRQRGVRDPAAGIEHLGEALGAADEVLVAVAQARVGLPDQGGDVARARAQARVDRRVQLGGEAQVDEDAGRAEHQRHHPSEDEGQPQADRDATQRPPSLRSR
jgi:hypothetical protein